MLLDKWLKNFYNLSDGWDYHNHGVDIGNLLQPWGWIGGENETGGEVKKKIEKKKWKKRRSGFGFKRSTAPTLTLRSIFLPSISPNSSTSFQVLSLYSLHLSSIFLCSYSVQIEAICRTKSTKAPSALTLVRNLHSFFYFLKIYSFFKKKGYHIYHNTIFTKKLSFAKTSIQAQPTPALPTMKAPTLRSVCFLKASHSAGIGPDLDPSYSCQRAG